MSGRLVRTGLVLAVLGESAAIGYLLQHRVHNHSLLLVTLATPVFALAVLLLARSSLAPTRAAMLIVAVGALLQLIALTRPPLTSDDDFRYIWDAKVQLAGIDPYRYAPDAPQLASLRDATLFAAPPHCGHPFPGGCTKINHPTWRTVYPPVAEAAFVLVRIASFGGEGLQLPYQLGAALGAVAVAWLLARRALSRRRAVWPVALWAWCPVTVSEFGNNAHIDWLAVLLVVLAFGAAGARRPLLSGLLAGAAIAAKLYPALVLPSLLRRHPRRVLAGAVGLVSLCYLPHVLAVGTSVIGSLPGYLRQEGYGSGTRLLLIGAVLPHPLDSVAGAAILGAVGYWAWRRSDADAPERTAVVVLGAAFLVGTPNYGWYAGLLIALAAMSGAVEWMPVALAPTFTYLYRGSFPHSGLSSASIYALAAALAALGYLLRRPDRLTAGLARVSNGMARAVSPWESGSR